MKLLTLVSLLAMSSVSWAGGGSSVYVDADGNELERDLKEISWHTFVKKCSEYGSVKERKAATGDQRKPILIEINCRRVETQWKPLLVEVALGTGLSYDSTLFTDKGSIAEQHTTKKSDPQIGDCYDYQKVHVIYERLYEQLDCDIKDQYENAADFCDQATSNDVNNRNAATTVQATKTVKQLCPKTVQPPKHPGGRP